MPTRPSLILSAQYSGSWNKPLLSVADTLPPGAGGGCPAHPQYANYWAPLTRKRHIPPHPAQPQHTNHWAPRTRKRHQQEHRPQRPPERSDPTQHAKGRTGDCPGPRKETSTRRNVTRGRGGGGVRGQGKICVPTIGPFHKFLFLPEENFSDVGGWVGRPGLARAPKPPIVVKTFLSKNVTRPIKVISGMCRT